MSLGRLIKNYRTRLGITQQQLADDVGVSHTYISKIEHDALSRPPSEALIEKIAERLICASVELRIASSNVEFRFLRDRAKKDVSLMAILIRLEKADPSEYDAIFKMLMGNVKPYPLVDLELK